MFVIIQGNVIDGLSIHGPFTDAERANEWADSELSGEVWVCAPLYKPEE